MTARCIDGTRAASYAYGLGCRCDPCRDWNAARSRHGRVRRGAGTKSKWDRLTVVKKRHPNLQRDADAAFRADYRYAEAMAKDWWLMQKDVSEN